MIEEEKAMKSFRKVAQEINNKLEYVKVKRIFKSKQHIEGFEVSVIIDLGLSLQLKCL